MKRYDCFVDPDRWIRCAQCRHKLGRIVENTNHNDCLVEVKCHSCKAMNMCYMNKNKEDDDERN